MVNTQHIHTFLSSYIQYSKDDIITLENLVEKETFYSLVNVALLKAYHQNNEKEKYEKLLPKVALMVPDRSILKKHIEDIVIKEILKEEIKTIEFSPERRTTILEKSIPEQEDIVENPTALEENPVEKMHKFSNETREDSVNILEENPDEHVEEIKEFLEENESIPEIIENDASEIILKDNLTETPEILEENIVENTEVILEENPVEKINEFSNESTREDSEDILEENPDEHVEEIKEFLKENESIPEVTENDESEIILEENLTETSEVLKENIVDETEIILDQIPVEKIHEFSNESTTEDSEGILEENPHEPIVEIHEFLKENESIPEITENDASENILKENITATSEISEENIVDDTEIVLEEIPVEKIHEFSNESTTEKNIEFSKENAEEENFFSWLKHFKNDDTETETAEPVEKIHEFSNKTVVEENEIVLDEKPIENIPEFSDQNPVEKIQEFSTEKPIERTQSEIDELLNKFITKNPSISRPKMNFYNPMDRAKESEEIKEDLASGTLAKIYVSQQLYDKAILVWEQLKKENPDKSSLYQKEIDTIKKLKKGK